MKQTLLFLLVFCGVASAQVVPVQTTLSNAVTANSLVFALASGTGVSAGQLLFVEREAMTVSAVAGSTVTVVRGAVQTNPAAHAAGVTVYAGSLSMFTAVDPTGACSWASGAVVINTRTGNSSTCTSGSIATTLYGSSSGGSSGNATSIQSVAVSSTAPTDGQLLGYSATAGNYLPLTLAQQLDSRPLQTVTLKPPSDSAASVTAGSTTTIASLTGPGTMERLQFASSTQNYPTVCSGTDGITMDSTFTLTVDGTTVWSGVSAGMLFGMYGYDATSNLATSYYRTKNRGVDFHLSQAALGAERKIFIQFASSLTLVWTNTSTCSAYVFSGVDWRPGVAPVGLYNPRYNKIHAYYVPFGSGSVGSTDGTVFNPLPTQTPGVAGLLDSIDVFILGVNSAPNWLEGHPKVTADGTLSSTQKGTEDFFGSHFYFANPTHSDEMGATFVGLCNSGGCGSNYYTGMYRYFREQPVTFSNSIAFSMENGHASEGPATTVAITFASLVIWYTVS